MQTAGMVRAVVRYTHSSHCERMWFS